MAFENKEEIMMPWDAPVDALIITAISEQINKEFEENQNLIGSPSFWKTVDFGYFDESRTGLRIYRRLTELLGSSKAASCFLSRAGILGIKKEDEEGTLYVSFPTSDSLAENSCAGDIDKIYQAEKNTLTFVTYTDGIYAKHKVYGELMGPSGPRIAALIDDAKQKYSSYLARLWGVILLCALAVFLHSCVHKQSESVEDQKRRIEAEVRKELSK